FITQLCRRAGFRPKFVQQAASVSNMFTLIGSEGAVTLVPAYLKSFPVAGVAMVPLSDTKATWDFLVVWQRGRTPKSLCALLDALAVSANSFEPRMDARPRIMDWLLCFRKEASADSPITQIFAVILAEVFCADSGT